MSHPQSTPLSIRRTHRYNDDYSHLDEWQEIGSAEIVRSFDQSNFQAEDMSDVPSSVIELRVTIQSEGERIRRRDIREALVDTFSVSRCRHDYDCCGCMTVFVSSAMPMNRRGSRWILLLSKSRNY